MMYISFSGSKSGHSASRIYVFKISPWGFPLKAMDDIGVVMTPFEDVVTGAVSRGYDTCRPC